MSRIEIDDVRWRVPLAAMAPERAEQVARIAFAEALRLIEREGGLGAGEASARMVECGPVDVPLDALDDHEVARRAAARLVDALRRAGPGGI